MQYEVIGYELVRSEAIRDEHGEIQDWSFTVIATSKTVNGLLRYARLKKLDVNSCDYGYTIESKEKEFIPACIGRYSAGYLETNGNVFNKNLEELL